MTMGSHDHDFHVAMISHLPHLLAAALMLASDDDAQALAAGSFRDATRVASSPPNLWRDICESNRGAIIYSIGKLKKLLEEMEFAISDDDFDAVEEMFAKAKAIRNELAEKKGWGSGD